MRRREFITLLGGAAAAWPMAVRPEGAPVPVIGYLDGRAGTPDIGSAAALRAGLADAGFTVGKNVAIEYRWANNQANRLRALAVDLVKHEVAVIVAAASLAPALAAMEATSTIPIVFIYGGDPVRHRLVASMNRPGGNLTGMTFLTGELAGKRLDLLHQFVPQTTTIGFLAGTPNFILYTEQTTEILAAGRALGVEIVILECRSDRDYDAAFATLLRRGAGALLRGAFPLPNTGKVIALAARHGIPTMYTQRESAAAGGLTSYGASARALYRALGSQYVARILKGAKPADLPVQQPTIFEFVINLQTARTLALTVPPTLLAIADEVIE
jgi:putative ABC transport system substrate-binding protein